MPRSSAQLFHPEGLLNYMQEAKGIHYQCSDLAKAFGQTGSTIRNALSFLLQTNQIQSVMLKGAQVYFVPGEKDSAPDVSETWRDRFKTYTLPKGFGDRCRELYPENHHLISVHQHPTSKTR